MTLVWKMDKKFRTEGVTNNVYRGFDNMFVLLFLCNGTSYIADACCECML